jgi:dihydroorotate dehydrogenase (fumarate)
MSVNAKFEISPALLNSSNPWATTEEDLAALYACPHTGAVTIRTSLWKAFDQHPKTHQYTFFSPKLGHSTAPIDLTLPEGRSSVQDGETSSLNTLGYSPIAYPTYLRTLVRMSQDNLLTLYSPSGHPKPFIVSVTGSADEVAKCCTHMIKVLNAPDSVYPSEDSQRVSRGLNLMMEINLSCPNIPDKPPPAYDGVALTEYIDAIAKAKLGTHHEHQKQLHVGIKTPPYTFHGQFQTLIDAIERSSKLEGGCPISFITATNTLGSCLVLDANNDPALGSANGTGIGGLAGDALHPLALGNVKTIRSMLDKAGNEDVRGISIIGIGGVSDSAGFRRMRAVGADAVGVGTAFGREGVGIFEKIGGGLMEH